MYFVDLEKASDRVLRKQLEWAISNKGLPEFLVDQRRAAVRKQIQEAQWIPACESSLREK